MSIPEAKAAVIHHDFNWSSAAEPWRWIGPQFRAECARITPRIESEAELRMNEIKRRRHVLGLSQSALAREVPCHVAEIGKIETRASDSPGVANRILIALDRLEMERHETQAARRRRALRYPRLPKSAGGTRPGDYSGESYH